MIVEEVNSCIAVEKITWEVCVLLAPWIAWLLVGTWLWFSFEDKNVSINLQIAAVFALVTPLDLCGTIAVFIALQIRKSKMQMI